MVEGQKNKLFFLGFIPKCPYYKPAPLLINLVIITLGTWGTYYFNIWTAVGYLIFSLLFYFLVMPLTICKYCYFKVTETTTDEGKEKTTKKLLTIEEWGKSHLHKHVGQKNWALLISIIWFLPVVLIVISFFMNTTFWIYELIALIGFIAVVVGNFFYMIKIKCPKCPIQEQCHSAF